MKFLEGISLSNEKKISWYLSLIGRLWKVSHSQTNFSEHLFLDRKVFRFFFIYIYIYIHKDCFTQRYFSNDTFFGMDIYIFFFSSDLQIFFGLYNFSFYKQEYYISLYFEYCHNWLTRCFFIHLHLYYFHLFYFIFGRIKKFFYLDSLICGGGILTDTSWVLKVILVIRHIHTFEILVTFHLLRAYAIISRWLPWCTYVNYFIALV